MTTGRWWMGYLEGEAALGVDGETIEAGESGSYSLVNILLCGSTGGAPLWGRDMVPRIFDAEDT